MNWRGPYPRGSVLPSGWLPVFSRECDGTEMRSDARTKLELVFVHDGVGVTRAGHRRVLPQILWADELSLQRKEEQTPATIVAVGPLHDVVFGLGLSMLDRIGGYS